jgi:hypothetical protein
VNLIHSLNGTIFDVQVWGEKDKVILSPIFRDHMTWSCDDSSANQMSQFLPMSTNFAIERPILHGNLRVDPQFTQALWSKPTKSDDIIQL